MIKRVNSTGRRRVPQDCVSIEVFDGDPRTFNAQFDFTNTDLPAEAEVVLEAVCAGSSMIPRFQWGTIGNLVPAANRQLRGLFGENIYFTVKVIDRTERFGRILGLAEGIRPIRGGKSTATGRRGILPIESCDIGSEPWRLEFRSEDVLLFVNSRIPGLKERIRYDAAVYSLIYPAVIRQILARLLKFEDVDEDAPEAWAAHWGQFAKRLHPDHAPPPFRADEAEQDEWIDAIAEAFCQHHELLDRFNRAAPTATFEDSP